MEYILPGGLENLWAEQITIQAGGSVAEAVFTQGHALVGILMPAAWTAALLGYEVSVDNVTYRTAWDNGSNLSQTKVQAGSYISIPMSDTVFAPYIRVKSVDGTNTAVNQVAAATLILLFRRYLGGN